MFEVIRLPKFGYIHFISFHLRIYHEESGVFQTFPRTACEESLHRLCGGNLDGQRPDLGEVLQACQHGVQEGYETRGWVQVKQMSIADVIFLPSEARFLKWGWQKNDRIQDIFQMNSKLQAIHNREDARIVSASSYANPRVF